ncbi:phage integrase N-terminal SAM-like domain-containing protein [Jannaschia sp. M317]|uniref:phage integrase N-terminal SAM-like domain-containing protein n=1 Tax=Jannaschia sp. M317 TaxID=2867011 RepID=UPI0021A734E7|nr:phage integrase N-terminal SAM-like domain-containing protein [Jannaschia sp. M317]UWQ19698.1 phage integrase N-terminal SAM-like domain-containing protein [Jannaschia sp. M317]
MPDQHVFALRRRFLENIRIKGLQPKTQTMYLRVMRDFTRFLGRSPDTATPEDLRAFQLDIHMGPFLSLLDMAIVLICQRHRAMTA